MLVGEPINVTKLAGDASLRKYYRLQTTKGSYVLMDSSEDPSYKKFIELTRLLQQYKINVPDIICEQLLVS